MITAQQEHKSRWRGRYWRRVELELVEGGASSPRRRQPKALVRISDEGSDVVRIGIADVAQRAEAARRACVLPRTEKLRLPRRSGFRSAGQRAPPAARSTAAPPPPEPPAPRDLSASPDRVPPAPGQGCHADAAPTVGALECAARQSSEKRRISSGSRARSESPRRQGAAPPVEASRDNGPRLSATATRRVHVRRTTIRAFWSARQRRRSETQ